ncbi:MAG: hypothetical protein LQ348_006926 [Seirophora lacunosa]|nr:MAG: hypothetical protein LQ348_006926 [Seirophora lacunosa]
MIIYVLTAISQTSCSITRPNEFEPKFGEYGVEAIDFESRVVRVFSTFELAKATAAEMAFETQQDFGGVFTSRMFQGDTTFGYVIFNQKMTMKRQLLVVAKVVEGEESDGARSMSREWGVEGT